MTRILVLEGPGGCGKSHHADRLAAALRADYQPPSEKMDANKGTK